MTYTATYSPEDNKLRLYSVGRLPADVYAQVKAAGFRWAPQQQLFVAPMWTPAREDLLLELCGDIGDEDTSLVDRAEERSERFEEYSENRARDAESARQAVAAIADNIPLGQPILVGHHSEKRARRDAEKIENGMRRAVKMWRTSQYWEERAKGALRHAKYKERPDVRARRIKGLEADMRKQERAKAEAEARIKIWERLHEPDSLKKKDGTPSTFQERAVFVAGRTNTAYQLYADLQAGKITPEQAQEYALKAARATVAWAERWAEHYRNRLTYERAMLADQGGTAADQTGPEKGGACKCWASRRGGWSYIQKVNRVSVTVLDNWGNGGANFTRTIPFDKLGAVVTRAQVEEWRANGALIEYEDKTGFFLRGGTERPATAEEKAAPKADNVCPDGAACPDKGCQAERKARGLPVQDFEAMAESLRAGVQVVSAPQLFPTPDDLAARMAQLADIRPGHSVLEPSAGTGQLIRAIHGLGLNGAVRLEVCELNMRLVDRLAHEFKGIPIIPGDFLGKTAFEFGAPVDRVVMNPPFENGSDIKHIRHALDMLRPGGRLVAICADGPRQRETLQPIASSWEELPSGTFAGTGVRSALLVIDK